jgi:TIR domain
MVGDCAYNSCFCLSRININVQQVDTSAEPRALWCDPTGELLSQAFLSHAGQDNVSGHNSANFTKHLAASLRRDGIQRFLDCDSHSLKLGADWSDDITDHAQRSRVMVAVLSPSYLERYWCMRELDLAITASKSNDGITIIPVFYGIDLGALLKDHSVTDKWRSVWEGFKAAGKEGVDVERWMGNLHVLDQHHQAGRHISGTKDVDNELELEQRVVQRVFELLRLPLQDTPTLGLDDAVKAVKELLAKKSTVAIVGVGECSS